MLSHLKEAERSYEQMAHSWTEQIEDAKDKARRTEKEKKQLEDKVATLQGQIDIEREKAGIQKRRPAGWHPASKMYTILYSMATSTAISYEPA